MKIYPITPLLNQSYQNKKFEEKSKSYNHQTTTMLYPCFNDYLLSFTARVDKGLERFYDTNKDRMPKTVKNYVENLEDKSQISPLEAQKEAFELLEIAQSIDDIKSAYPDEPLFNDLINPTKSKAKRGILNSIKENEELLALDNKGILKDKSNLTVYLVKKVFLENKTIEEINQDLEQDLEEDFKNDFKFKNEEAKYIYTTTLNALGIHAPEFEYRQSLRYTKDGYSDLVGDKISEGQKAFWNSLTQEERNAKAKKSVQEFENWWNSMTKNQILDMIADQKNEIEMLKEFKKYKKNVERESLNKNQETTTEKTKVEHHRTKVGSSKLSQDELFIKWASNNLKIYMENMSEAEKDSLHIKRMQRLTARWSQMTPTERTDYISKMKSGSEPLRYTMIDAWNHCTDLILDLSNHLKVHQVYKPTDLIYSTQEFSEFQSKVMLEFWDEHPEHTEKLGYNIRLSQEKVQAAIQRGTFEELKRQILRDKNQRIKELEKIKKQNEIAQTTPTTKEPDYFEAFKKAYYQNISMQLRNLPAKYVEDYFKSIQNGFTKDEIEAWTRNLKGEKPLDKDIQHLEHIKSTEPEGSKIINRGLEAAVADTLYACTQNPEVYLFSHSDVKVALSQIVRGEPVVKIASAKLDRFFEMPVIKRKFDDKRISYLYKQYTEQLKESEINDIINSYFVVTPDKKDDLQEYINTYGKSINIIFSDKSSYPIKIKKMMFEKFMNNMPASLAQDMTCFFEAGPNAFEQEENINRIKFAFAKRFDFVPRIFMDKYSSEMGKSLRLSFNHIDMDTWLNKVCQKRTNPKQMAKLVILNKTKFSTENKFRTLAMEQVLADALYESTGNIKVYGLHFEELCDNIELFNLVKKFPSEARHLTTKSGELIDLNAKKRTNISNLQAKYFEYFNEIVDWVNTDVKTDGFGKIQDLVYILNPDENMPEKDTIIYNKIKTYDLNLREN